MTGYVGERVIGNHIQGLGMAYNPVTSSVNNTAFDSANGKTRLDWLNYAVEQKKPYDFYLRSVIHAVRIQHHS